MNYQITFPTRQLKITWLERFLQVWESDVNEAHHMWLCKIYDKFCDENNLPLWSAEEVIDLLRRDI